MCVLSTPVQAGTLGPTEQQDPRLGVLKAWPGKGVASTQQQALLLPPTPPGGGLRAGLGSSTRENLEACRQSFRAPGRKWGGQFCGVWGLPGEERTVIDSTRPPGWAELLQEPTDGYPPGPAGWWAAVLTSSHLGWGTQPGRGGLWMLDSVAQGPGKRAKNSWRQLSPHYIWQRIRRL